MSDRRASDQGISDGGATEVAEATGPPLAPGARRRRASAAVGLLAVLASALVGGNFLGLRDRLLGSATPKPRAPARSRVAGGPTATSGLTATTKAQETVLRSFPWWQSVGSWQGAGSTSTPAFTIDGAAAQWRVKWTCEHGNLVVQASTRPRPLVSASCPGTDVAYATASGATVLAVTADGPWHLQLDQQVDMPLDEPPLPAMTAAGATATATGTFYRVDQVGSGRVTIYRLADGSRVLRLDGFYVTPNSDLEVRLSPLEAPHSTDEFTAAPSASVAALDVTAGSMNFNVPQGVDPGQYRSVVIWCERLHSAYAAASLVPPPRPGP
jgi:hypothetical protein